MTSRYASPSDVTVARPTVNFTLPTQPVPSRKLSTPSKSGWIISGFAAVLAVAALGVVGGLALDIISDSAPEPAATIAPLSAPSTSTPAPAPVITPTPVSAPIVTVTRAAPTVVVHVAAPPPGFSAAPVPTAETTPAPEPSWPKPPTSHNPLPRCGDLVACNPWKPPTK